MDVKARRQALGWSRADLAERSGLNSALIAMMERGDWSEEDAWTRVAFVLGKAEEGDLSVRLPPPERPAGG
jgi:transcriptional regulator with XRE-family HTH domain